MATSTSIVSNQAPVINLILIGDTAAGKTCFLKRLTDDAFTLETRSTVGMEFSCLRLTLPSGLHLKVHLWDTAGQECFRSMAPMYYRKADGVLLLYEAISSPDPSSLSDWHKEVERSAPEGIPILTMATKADHPAALKPEDPAIPFISSRSQSKEELLKNVIVPFVQTIVDKKGIRVELKPEPPKPSRPLRLSVRPVKKKSGGCC